MTSEERTTSPDRLPGPAASNQPSSCLDILALLIISAIISAVTFIRHFVTLNASINPDQAPSTALIGIGVQLVVLSAILIPLGLFWPSLRRKIYQAWLLAHFLGMLFAPALFLNLIAKQQQALAQIVIGVIFWLFIPVLFRWLPEFRLKLSGQAILENGIQPHPDPGMNLWATALLVGLIAGYPWLALGALGSITDTLLMAILSLVIGLIAGALMQQSIFDAEPLRRETLASQVLMRGIGLSTLLLLLTSSLSFSYGGIQLLEMIAVPGLGWLIVFLQAMTVSLSQGAPPESGRPLIRTGLPYAILVGITVAFPLLFIDPDELILSLGLSPGEILGDAFRAALLTTGSLIVLDFVLLSILTIRNIASARRQPPRTAFSRTTGLLFVLFVVGLAFAGYLYTRVGRPGFYGENIFVIFKDQASLNSLPDGLDYAQRRQAVYDALTKQADQSQQKIRATLDRFGISYTPYYLVNAIEVQADPIVRFWLSTRPEVDRILENPELRPLPGPLPVQSGNAAPPSGVPWNLSLIGADQVWKEFNVRGAGVVVGQSDSGADGSHPELADSYRGQNGQNDYNWWDPWYGTTAPNDIMGHGTHTLATILGDHTGIAPDAQWIACINEARDMGNPAYYLDCMQFMLAPFPQKSDPFKDGKPALGAEVLNNSWGCPDVEGCDTRVFQPAMQALKAAGIFVVASAGNDGPQCASIDVPLPIYPDVVSVGAIDRNGQLAFFSSLGPVNVLPNRPIKPDIVAPGVDVLSALPKNTYGALSGTSMAGPHVVGTVALMWSANPKLVGDIDQTVKILERAASPYQGNLPNCPGANQNPSTAVGYGVLDAYKAVQLALGIE